VLPFCATIVRYAAARMRAHPTPAHAFEETPPMTPVPLTLTLRVAFAPALTAGLAAVALALPAAAGQINTGPEAGAYHASFCPALKSHLKLAQFDYACTPSNGTRENVERVLGNPRQLGFGQLDVFVQEARALKGQDALTLVRQDDARQCLFAATRNKQVTNYGELAGFAGRLRFILPPPDSGSAATFRFLRALDGEGLGRARSVSNAASTEAAIREALSADDTVTLFVAFADPDSDDFALIGRLGGHVVPVIDRAILRQEVEGKKIYFAQETQVEAAGWIRSGHKVVTACTPLVVFTGRPEQVTGEQARKDHADLIRTIGALPSGALLPEEPLYQKLLKRTKELSAVSTEKVLELTDQAREKAKPYTDQALDRAKEIGDQAKQATERATEAAKPYIDKTREAAQKAYEDALKAAKDLMDKSKPDTPKKN
jgi:hypothetical protein